MKETLRFLDELAANNNRDWFAANRERYLCVKERTENLATRLIASLSEFELSAAMLEARDCMYRIYRDTRFSADKTPYKRHIGIFINPFGGKKSQLAGYYLHLEPNNVFVGGGIWCPTAPVLKAVRRSIFDNVDEYIGILNSNNFRSHFNIVGEDFLKTAPKGFPKDWEHIDLLRPRSFTALGKLPEDAVAFDDVVRAATESFKALQPFNNFLNYVYEECPGLPRFFD